MLVTIILDDEPSEHERAAYSAYRRGLAVGDLDVDPAPLATAGGLGLIRSFYRDERDHHGSYMSAAENVTNATERRLSCRTEEELIALRDAALTFAGLCEAEICARDADDEVPPAPYATYEPAGNNTVILRRSGSGAIVVDSASWREAVRPALEELGVPVFHKADIEPCDCNGLEALCEDCGGRGVRPMKGGRR